MLTVPTDTSMLETATCSGCSRRFGNLRSLQWRIDLGILPSSATESIDDLRRVTADSRRRYATLRRKLLIDPHLPKDGTNSADLIMDNPLSQNPDSMWGRFFRNAELERMLDQDLTRLYPERGSYFQTSGCQGMLRRILLLWCVRNPEYGYRQGMHELLAPLLYVLQVDIERQLEVRKTYENQFTDQFDGFSYHENDLTYKFDFKKFSEDENELGNSSANSSSLSELDPEIQAIILLSDAYGAEGELGVVLSDKFMEHDAYSMFDALLSGSGGPISMAEFFNPNRSLPNRIVPPVIEASRAVYHLLSIADSSLYSHLVGLEVEPQYFGLRWLRVLFGREFSLEDLLIIWDEIFSHENVNCNKAIDGGDSEFKFEILDSPRGAFICAFAVSMILNLRSSLLATEITTASLQRLLNYPDDVKVEQLLKKANTLYRTVLQSPVSPVSRGRSASPDQRSPRTPLSRVPESYWEEKWRDLHKKEEENKVIVVEDHVKDRVKGWSDRVRFRLLRTASDPSPSKGDVKNPKIRNRAVRRNLLQDLEEQLGVDEAEKVHDKASTSSVDENEPDSSVASNSSVDENDDSANVVVKPKIESKPGTSKFHKWIWGFGKKQEEGTTSQKANEINSNETEVSGSTVDQNLMVSLKNLGQSMLENIQVIESVFQQDNNVQKGGLKNVLVGKGQMTALTALKELRKISNVLSEM